MKKKLLILFKIAAFALVFALVYLMVEFVLEERTSNDKYAEFFREKNDILVLFMGNSHVTNDIYPMELYRDYGIVSYNFGGHANTLPTTYWIIKNTLDYTAPRLIVLDMRSVGSNLKHSEKVRYLHISLDCFPMSKNKLDAINDILGKDERAEFLWKMWIYHDRWDELEPLDFTGERKLEKGAETRINVSRKAKYDPAYDRSVKLTERTVGEDYLDRIVLECKERGIELLLVYLPVSVKEDNLAEINSAGDIAEKYDARFINFNEMDIVDFSTDFNDAGAHLNPSGARKVSDCLGRYISENYDIEDLREDERYASWKGDLKAYDRMKEENLKNEDDIYNFIMLISDKNYDTIVSVYDSQVYEDELIVRLLKNAGLYDERQQVDERDGDESDIRFTVRAEGRIICEKSFEL